jgi:hypothetical protein
MKTTRIFYWIATGLLGGQLALTGVADVLGVPQVVQSITRLGYPLYLIPFLGVLKGAGVLTLLAPGLRRLREGAYAGIFFYAAGAAYSHLAFGDPFSQALPGMVMLGLAVASYRCYRLLMHAQKNLPKNVTDLITH